MTQNKAKQTSKTGLAAALAVSACVPQLQAQTSDALINKLVQKGVLTDQEAKDLVNETVQTNNLAGGSKWKIDNAIKSIGLFGDVRFRYEYRSAENPPGSGVSGSAYYRERFRYAVRLGIRGDLFDNFYYGLRVETSTNPRSPWNTFADDSTPTPSGKTSDGINIGQVYVGWKPTDWYEMTVGKMPMPLYVTPMIWDSDINPEGAVEKIKVPVGDVDLFANFGQFIYQDTNPDQQLPSSDTFILAWQVGANVKLAKDVTFKVAPVLYTYTGQGSGNGINQPFSGEGKAGLNTTILPTFSGPQPAAFNQNGINDLTILEVPAEVNFKIAKYNARVFGDFGYNFEGDDRARAAYTANLTATPHLGHAFTGQDKAYQAGVAFGNLGLVYGQTSKKHTWEARAYWQHVEQYAADVNLLDSDFFEGRANLEGVYAALAYSITDNIIGTFRYGYAERINEQLGTGGNNGDLPGPNPIKNYHLVQLDLTWRF
jgi:Putative porin